MKPSEFDDAAAEAREDREWLAIAEERMKAVLDGTDRLIPLEEVMREFGLTPADEPDDQEWLRPGASGGTRAPAPGPGD